MDLLQLLRQLLLLCFSFQRLLQTCSRRETRSAAHIQDEDIFKHSPVLCRHTQPLAAGQQHSASAPHTHAQTPHPPHESGKAAKMERKSAESRTPTCPCGVGMPVGKSQVKTVAHDGSVSGSPGWGLLSLPALLARPRSASVRGWVGVGWVSVAAQRCDDAERARERRSCCCCYCPQGLKETLSSPVNTDLQRSALTSLWEESPLLLLLLPADTVTSLTSSAPPLLPHLPSTHSHWSS